ncbi:hypothetical protein [Microcella sp.]|uniref:hypothetical protein n=1 Tax=Microcella sp. TaxID=1913979 RepID=UPI003918C3DE
MAFLGLAILAIARVARSPLDSAVVVSALLWGALLAVVLVGGIVCLVMLPVHLRNRALRREQPGRLLFTVSGIDGSHEVLTNREAAPTGRIARLLPVTITVGGDRLDFWTGGVAATLWGSVRTAVVASVEIIDSRAGMQRAKGVRFALVDLPPIELVPVGPLGAPLSAKKRRALFDELIEWIGTKD